MQALEVQTTESTVEEYGAVIPTAESVIYTDDPREMVAKKFEEMAARLRSGELRGARIEWNEDAPAMVRVEVFQATYFDEKYQEERRAVRLTRTEIKPTAERLLAVVEP